MVDPDAEEKVNSFVVIFYIRFHVEKALNVHVVPIHGLLYEVPRAAFNL